MAAMTDPADVIITATTAEFHASLRRDLSTLGLTYTELEDQARRGDFTSEQAHVLWVSVGGTVDREQL
jgi:hypothetical protein